MKLPMLLLMAIGTMSAQTIHLTPNKDGVCPMDSTNRPKLTTGKEVYVCDGKQEKPPAEPALITVRGPLRFMGEGGVEIGRCDQDDNGRLANCTVAEGHTLTEMLQVCMDALQQAYALRDADNAYVLKELKKMDEDLQPVAKHAAVPAKQKPAPTK